MTKAVPFDVTLPDGETLHMKGGYYPIKFNAEKSGKAAEQENNAAAMGAMSGAQALGTRRSFTKSRSEYDVYRPLLLEFSVIPKHLQDVIHNITYRVPARDVYRLVASRKVEEYVAGTLGREYYDVLKEWATDVWNILPGTESIAERKVDRVFGALRRNSVMAIMGYRIWPVIENVSNIGPVMDKLGAANGLAAVADFYAHYDEAKKLLYKSVFMRNRINSMDRDIGRQEGMFEADARPFEIIRSHAYDLMLYSDLALSAPLWVRAYKDAYAGKVAEVKRENEEAIQAVLKAQKDVEDIRARILDLSLNISDINQHLDVRKHGTAEDIEAARSSPFAVRTEEELREEVAGNTAEIKEALRSGGNTAESDGARYAHGRGGAQGGGTARHRAGGRGNPRHVRQRADTGPLEHPAAARGALQAHDDVLLVLQYAVQCHLRSIPSRKVRSEGGGHDHTLGSVRPCGVLPPRRDVSHRQYAEIRARCRRERR